MGKLDKLQQGAKKTGSGLFDGMKPLKAREEEAVMENNKTSDIVKEEKMTKTVNKKPEIKPVEEKRSDILDSIMEKEPVNVESEPVEEIKEEIVEKIEEPVEEIKTEVNKSNKKASNAEDKSASRYEKDKCLLLDIRGYRDYVEHMSKAANMSATKYIRGLIEKDMEKNKDIYDAHKKLEQMLMNRS